MGVIGCILGFLIVIYLCYKDWSVYLATFAGACVVIACNTLPFIDSLVGDYVSGMFTAVKSFFFMILFGCLQSKIYTESGAAYTIADTVMNRLLKENMSNTGKNLIGMSVILVIGTILNLGGIIAGVVIVLMYPIALVIFERCDIPKKFILGILGAGSFTFTLTVPGSPQVTNVAAITGSATGIGRAFAEEAAKRGMRLALIDINTEGLEETKAICEKAGAPKVVTIKTDVTKYEEVRFSIQRVMQEYGQLDLMFANAGIATAGWVYNHPPQDWAWAMNTNVLGLTYYVHEVLPIFKQQGTPCHFLFTASIAGLITGLRYNTAYLASKHAAVCIAEAVRDLAENDPDYSMMGVSVFCPEYVHTNIHNSEDHRPADYSVPCDPFYATDSYWDYRRLFDSNITVKGMNPAFVGPYLFEAVEENHMYKMPHMHTHEQIRARHRRIESDLEREEALHEKYAPLQKY